VCVYVCVHVCVCARACVRARVRACRALLSDFKDDKYQEKTTRMKEQGTYVPYKYRQEDDR
jgi:hypothetical protein